MDRRGTTRTRKYFAAADFHLDEDGTLKRSIERSHSERGRRFSFGGKSEVDTQWQLFRGPGHALFTNIGKFACHASLKPKAAGYRG